jgi:hypothetical protein
MPIGTIILVVNREVKLLRQADQFRLELCPICALTWAAQEVYSGIKVFIRQVSMDFRGFAGLVAVHPRHSLSANMDTSVNIC